MVNGHLVEVLAKVICTCAQCRHWDPATNRPVIGRLVHRSTRWRHSLQHYQDVMDEELEGDGNAEPPLLYTTASVLNETGE